jgi:rRNA-processing protein FCF1
MSSEPVGAFLDTMIYLHYRPVAEIDWQRVLGAARVDIVVPRIIIRELDRHKNNRASSRISERARRTLAWLEQAVEGGEVRPGVRVRRWGRSPGVDYTALGLNPTWNDDELVASILDFRAANPESTVVLVTQDAGPRFTARDHGIQAISLEESLRLSDDLDPAERENRELRQRLQKLEQARPQLRLTVEENADVAIADGHLRVTLRQKFRTPDEFITQAVQQASREVPVMRSVGLAVLGISEGELARYAEDRAKYLEKVRRHAEKTYALAEERARSFVLTLLLENTGTAPADDVDVDLHIPDGPTVGERPPEDPEPPDPPHPPRTTAQIMRRSLLDIRPFTAPPILPSFGDISRGPPNVSGFDIERSDSYDIRNHVRRVKHASTETLGTLYFTFPSPSLSAAQPFGIDYRLNAANVPEPVSGSLHVVVSVAEGPVS